MARGRGIRFSALLLLAASALGDVAVPKEGEILRGAFRVDRERGVLVADESEEPLAKFLLVEKDDGALVWAPDLAARIAGCRRIADERILDELYPLARRALSARDAVTARRLYAWAKELGLSGSRERSLHKKVIAEESKRRSRNEKKIAPVLERERELRALLPSMLVARVNLAEGDDALRLLRAALEETPAYAPAKEALAARAPADHPLGDGWLEWRLDFEPLGFSFAGEDDVELKKARHYWRPDLLGFRTRRLLVLTPVRDAKTLRACLVPGELVLRKLEEFFATEKPVARPEEPLLVYLYSHPQNFTEQAGYTKTATVPPYFRWRQGHYDLQEDLTRLMTPEDQKELRYLSYVTIFELTRHWLWSRNPRYGRSQVMRSGEVPGYWVVAGLPAFLAEAEWDLDAGTVDLARKGTWSLKLVRKHRERLIPWRRFLFMSEEAVHLANGGDRLPDKTHPGELFHAQSAAACHYLFNGDGGKRRAALFEYLANHYRGDQAALAPPRAFGLGANDFGQAVADWASEE